MEFRILGPLEVLHNGDPLKLGGPKQRAVLSVLIAHAGRAVPVARLTDELWGDDPPPTAATALQVYISALRKVLGDRVVSSRGTYLLDLRGDDLDADRFEELVARGRSHRAEHPARTSADLGFALALWRGDAYADLPSGPTLQAEQARLDELRLAVVEDRAEAELELGKHAHLLSELAGLAVQHPTRERLVSLYMLTAYRCRRVGDAMRAYETLRTRLHDEYGVEPSQETRSLARSISRRDPTLDAPWPEWIPAPTSRFVGRRRELLQLGEQLLRTRLLTITGPGGAGKTRLSLEIGREAVHDHPDGVRFIDLSSAPVGSSVAATIAGVLGDREQPGIDLLETLATELQRSRVLLILDNCEHLVDDCAKVCRQLLERCPGVRILATSREPLGLGGERVWPLSGLALPVAGDVSEVAARSESVRLFTDRAQAAAPTFTLGPGPLATVSELCRRLDGMPLAIELAAAQLRTQSLDEVASRLGQRLDLQDARSRTLPERHRTMRAAIDWSHRLLSPREQATFRRLSVFKGGFTRDAVERVAADSKGFAPNDAAEVFDALTQLVDRSLVVAESSIDNGSVGTRYRMVETIAGYAAERLAESREEQATRVRHAAWVSDLAEATEKAWATDKNATLILTAEHDNVRMAIEWTLGDGQDPQRALQISSQVWWFWWTRGLMEEGRDLLERGLSASSSEPSQQRGAALRAAASLARSSGDYAAAYRLGEECLRVNRTIGLERGIGFALNSLAITLQAQNEIEASLRLLAESRERYASAGDERGQASALNNMGNSLRASGRLEEATESLQDALERFRKLSDRRGEAAVLTNLAICARRSGEVQRSRDLSLHALTLYTELGLAEGQTDIFDCLAWCELAEGRALSALRLLAAADQVRRRLGSPRFSPDEIADYEDAIARARKLVGSRAPALERAAEEVTLDDLVAEILHDASTSSTGLNAAG